MHKVGNVGIFVFLIFEKDGEISQCNLLHKKHHGKCQCALKLIRLSTISNLLEVNDSLVFFKMKRFPFN